MTPTTPRSFFVALVSIFALGISPLVAMPFISEFLAINDGVTVDEDGEPSDWIEIFNPTDEAIALEGYTLTDSIAEPAKWTFPAVMIEPRGFVLVFASMKDRVDPAMPLHANFSLDGGGEYLALYAPDVEEPVSSLAPEFPNQRRNISYGASGFTEGAVGFLSPPTPLEPNVETAIDFVADTKFSVDRGFFSEPVTVEITTDTVDAEIRFTVDGTMPAVDSGTLYTEPVIIESTTILQAIATKAGAISSNVDVQTYLFVSDVKLQATMDARVTADPAYVDEIDDALGETLPAMSIVVDNERMFGPTGIYTDPFQSGRPAEVPISLEYFSPTDPEDRFQIDGGIRIHGGDARNHPKKPFRLYFREDYSDGSGELEHALFEGSNVKSFEQLVLRGGGHDGWSLADRFGATDGDIPPHGSFLRDQFLRKTEAELGMLTPLGKYVHVYINGVYWGIYDVHERPNDAFFADRLGGSKSDWDVIHHPEFFDSNFTVVSGDSEAWEDLQSIASGQVADEVGFERIQDLVNLDSYIDSMIVRMWSGDFDWCGPVFQMVRFNGELAFNDVTIFGNKNWYAGRRSRNGGTTPKFQFFTWDAEMSMGNHLLGTLPQRFLDFDLSRSNDLGSPVAPYDALVRYPPFQRVIADRLSKHLFNDGVLSPPMAKARLQEMIDELRTPIVAESARWGNTAPGGEVVFTRDDHWLSEVEWLRDVFIEERPERMLDGFRDRGVYPVPGVPTFSRTGGRLNEGETIGVTSSAVTPEIYYTTDGSDPAEFTVYDNYEILGQGARCNWLVPNAGNGALNPLFPWYTAQNVSNAKQWFTGRTGLGFEMGDQNFRPYLGKSEVSPDLIMNAAQTPGVYCRINFAIPSAAALENLDALILKMRYDDGFVAFINGTRVASANVPGQVLNNGVLDPRAVALSARTDEDAIIAEAFDVTEAVRGRLTVGAGNVLAIHVVNASLDDSDIMISPTMELRQIVSQGGPTPTARKTSGEITLEGSGVVKVRALDVFGRWSALAEAFFQYEAPLQPGDLSISEIHYQPARPATEAELAESASRNGFEFLELRNERDFTIELEGAEFVRGVRFTFPPTQLAPGERVVVVRNEAAFAARYGSNNPNIRIVGAFAMDSKLSDMGETLELVSKEGEVLLSFRYNDKAPWPEDADGSGASLVYRPTGVDPDQADASQWTASLEPNGTPGTGGFTVYGDWQEHYFPSTIVDGEEEPIIDPLGLSDADPDGDELPNLLEYVFGSHPLRPSEKTNFMNFATMAEIEGADGPQLVFQFLRRPDMEDVTYAVDLSEDLKTWALSELMEEDLLLEANISNRERASVIVMPPDSSNLYGRLQATLLEMKDPVVEE